MKPVKKPMILISAGAVLAAVVLGIWISGPDTIQPGVVSTSGHTIPTPEYTTTVQREVITEVYEAVGTVRPRTETRIEAQVTAQVVDVKVRPGNKVEKGQLLIRLDNRKLTSRLDQARQGLNSANAGKKQAQQAVAAAQAAFDQASSAYRRTEKYYQANAATKQDMEQAEAAYRQAEAGLARSKESTTAAVARTRQAQEVIREATIALGYTEILAPESGEVLRRMVEPGDLALPGKPLLFLQTEGTHRLEAEVREGLIDQVRMGDRLAVEIRAVGAVVDGTVEEIVPYADPQSRTFLVKVGLPPITGIYPGMFGKLRVPVGRRAAITVPAGAVRQVGQLELIRVKDGERWTERYIKTGRRFDGSIEVLTGLDGGETIGTDGTP